MFKIKGYEETKGKMFEVQGDDEYEEVNGGYLIHSTLMADDDSDYPSVWIATYKSNTDTVKDYSKPVSIECVAEVGE